MVPSKHGTHRGNIAWDSLTGVCEWRIDCQRVQKIIGGNSDCLALGGQWRLVTTLGTQWGRGILMNGPMRGQRQKARRLKQQRIGPLGENKLVLLQGELVGNGQANNSPSSDRKESQAFQQPQPLIPSAVSGWQ